ncbi:conserved hypothetical protein [Anaeromyxobacter sp. K]|uniref:hypothetical protein n=1 Tax=Anaeromyxobacter sp. (strain K) TaxID=447217 RepID=UPI00015F8458|nr:hypothetical protein [Anaeromyxobacter sp. K]ACG74397.1 conserved hypothetical protein [Anaeromyxobacter sp. K]
MLDDLVLILTLVGTAYGITLLVQRRVHRLRGAPARIAVGHRLYASPLVSSPGSLVLPRTRVRGLRGAIGRLLG